MKWELLRKKFRKEKWFSRWTALLKGNRLIKRMKCLTKTLIKDFCKRYRYKLLCPVPPFEITTKNAHRQAQKVCVARTTTHCLCSNVVLLPNSISIWTTPKQEWKKNVHSDLNESQNVKFVSPFWKHFKKIEISLNTYTQIFGKK